MLHRKLGKTGIAVSKIALGTMYFASETSEEDAFAILDTFVEAGGNLIDNRRCICWWRLGTDHRALVRRTAS
jgi:predicted aldo/keto reductase-like oxidoreductase